ncbi:aminotransferase class V-fold PLP-dependent enzyme [Dermatobacter hominis]|uniref:aminotransferase class V-fold PLP-dependent enzyme n=1 Tax=Dermatobacter hominis TaxID=2884263 RepID=UPI001D111945|nr:aminotransferase class V-fold PLP-dependent enzyme [Dermatobacter hominis]UDY36450.1 aminotransferase class V-fold PLP-dependent enzyme [Dermatobacter hominis]
MELRDRDRERIDGAWLDERLRATEHLDQLRRDEFSRLDAQGHVYLDHTGAGLYPESLVRDHLELLQGEVLGNPHSDNPTSRPMTEMVERARAAVLRFCSADPDEYACVFTPNATGAIRLVGESFPFAPDRPLVLSSDNHNSVNGVREHARRAGAPVTYVPVLTPDLRLDDDALRRALAGPPGLLAFPAQSNYSGVQHPYPSGTAGWRVLLDAAAYAPTNPLRLDRHRPDFVSLSFYKVFGYPTGVGALIARKEALAELRRPWFAGGTIAVASVAADGHRLVPGHAGFEDGTLDFLSLPAVTAGIELMERIDVRAVHDRVQVLTAFLLERLQALRHANGSPLVRVLGPWEPVDRGGTVAFVLADPHGREVPDRLVAQMATRAGISLRTGCFCNPGAGETARDVAAEDIRPFLDLPAGTTVPVSLCEVDQAFRERRDVGVSALRVSLGMSSNPSDVRALVALLEGLLDRGVDELGAPPPVPPLSADTA